MSPSLFGIFINDLSKELNELKIGLNIDGLEISHLLYADALALLAENEENLQNLLSHVLKCCRKWRVVINMEKSNPKTIFFFNYHYQIFRNFLILYIPHQQFLVHTL